MENITSSDNLQLPILIFKYLENQNYIKLFQTKIEELKAEKNFVALDFPIHLQIGDLQQYGILATLLLNDLATVRSLFQELLFLLGQILTTFGASAENDSDTFVRSTPPHPSERLKTTLDKFSIDANLKSVIAFSLEKYLGFDNRQELTELSPEDIFISKSNSLENFDHNLEIVPDFTLLEDNNKSQVVKDHGIIFSSVTQIFVRLKIEGCSNASPWGIKEFKNIRRFFNESPSIAFIAGTIIAVSIPRRYVLWVEYRCTCVASRNQIYVKTIADSSSRPISCSFCFADLIENPSTRATGETSSIKLQLESDNPSHHSMTVIAKDEKFEDLEPGKRIEASVFVTPSKFTLFPKFEISKIYDPIPHRFCSSLPLTIRTLMEDRQSSPWSFVLTLGYMFASNVSPLGTYHRLKVALLLSLTSMAEDKRGLAVLAVGKDESIQKKLLNYATRYAPRAIFHSNLNSLGVTVLKENDGNVWIEGGSLCRAKGGVCVLNDLSYFKNSTKSFLCSTLESGSIRVDASEKLKSSFPFKCYPLRAAIWSTFNPTLKKGTATDSTNELFLHVSVGDLSKSIADVFGIVIYSEEPSKDCEHRIETLIALQILTTRVGKLEPITSPLPFKELKQYIDMVKGIELNFSAEAEHLLRGYYVVLRRLRGECTKGSAMPITAINTLTEVAKSHAKLSLRNKVEIWDATAAILLCEEALTSRTGYSPLGIKAMPHIDITQDLHHTLGKKNDDKMMKFMQQVTDLINRCQQFD